MSRGRGLPAAAVWLGLLLALGLLAYGAATSMLTAMQAAIGAGIVVVPVVATLALRATRTAGVPGIAQRRRVAVRRYYLLRDLRAEVERELVRSRRYDRSFVVARAALPTARSGAARSGVAAETVAERLRRIDRAWVDDSHLYLLLPESDRRGAEQVAERLLADYAVSDLRLATFPQDGVTAGALLATLRGAVDVHVREHVPPATRPSGGRRSGAGQVGGRRRKSGQPGRPREAAVAIDQGREAG